ncbi:hypothetical protein BJ684DRAFT_7895, partial [Piptocephalis cylindrospora]
NTLVSELKTRPWTKLLQVIGCSTMIHLLRHCSLFRSLPNGCFYQLCGRSFWNL